MTNPVAQYDVRTLTTSVPLPFSLACYGGSMLYVDLTDGTVERKPLDPAFAKEWIGGRGFGAKLLYDNLPPKLDAFDPKNILFVGPGVFAGTLVPANARVVFMAKSPLGQIGWANMGGHFAAELKQCGIDGIVVTGRADHPVYLRITEEDTSIRDASAAWG